MIKSFRLTNFKAFKDTGVMELKPITVLAGPNSGGKSSVLQSLLLLKQTLESEEPGIVLDADGRFLQFTELKDITFGKPAVTRCKINYYISLETEIPLRQVEQYFPDATIPDNQNGLPLTCDFEIFFSNRKVNNGEWRITMNHFGMASQLYDISGPRLTIDLQGDEYIATIKGRGIEFPEPYKGMKVEGLVQRHFLPELFALKSHQDDAEIGPTVIPLMPIFRAPIISLRRTLERQLKYLGPLREEPQRAYMHTGSPYPEIGRRGEFAAQMLWIDKDEKVQYQQQSGEEIKEIKLLDAVRYEFQRLGLDETIYTSAEKAIIYQILFGLPPKGSKKRITIADVGFGVSQLLPIIVMTLKAPEKSLLLLEQPEIHLHPKCQANLADFLLSQTNTGKQILVETHSDHLINRLRRRIAEDTTDELKNKINILFVHPPYNGEGARIEPLEVDKYGIIENWPPDFLPEATEEAAAIFRAGITKRGVG